jgi:hypothetical protein
VNHNFKHEIKLAGKDWAQVFRRRTRELRVTKPVPTRVIRVMAFNKIEITRIYVNLVTIFWNISLDLIISSVSIKVDFHVCFGNSTVKNRLRSPQVLSEGASLCCGSRPGNIYICSKSGWMNENLSVIWLKTFVSDVHSSIQTPHF